ncbi:MAG: amino acid adenylation domain-containing protein, partial [Bacteroidales bacterium]|nr:amino acid adenylation domain-containing protein [Bacteroidales bacterium]
PNYEIFILGKNLELLPIGVSGELCIGGEGLARGYLCNEKLTSEKFIDHPFKAGERLYKTGDLTRWLSNGNIEFLGRIDHQVKIRGFRIELGEIENVLLQHKSVWECVVLAREEQGDKYLCAYIVSDKEQNNEELRIYLSGLLPDYMIPSYFVELDEIPLTNNGKVNRKALPVPEIKAGGDYFAPSTLIESKLVKIWSDILNIPSKEISTRASFFELGGHSLKATVLVARIHKALEVRIKLRDIFQYQTIREQAGLISSTENSSYFSIPKAREQEYYPLSSSQRRLYLLQQLDLGSTAYNMPGLLIVPQGQDKQKITRVFNKLIAHHENFRTSFEVENDIPVQRIYSEVSFSIKEYQLTNAEILGVREDFIQAFDLSQAPLLRVGYLEISDGEDMLLVDMHHIISDGRSHSILQEDFSQLLSGTELEPLHLQYKDYSQWQNSSEQQERIKGQEAFWLDKFTGELPVLELPTDYSRPVIQSFEGARVVFVLTAEETQIINGLCKDQGLTLYMSLLSIFTIMLSKLSGQEDIIVGSPIAARRHADLEDIVGVFVNTLAIRSDVSGDKGLIDYLQELKENTLEAYENQEYQFEDLVEQVIKDRDTSRNPLFNVMFNLLERESREISDSAQDELVHTSGVSKFDLSLTALDQGSVIKLSLEYSTKLFKSETIDRYIVYFKQIINHVGNNSNISITEIELLSPEERNQLLYDFNETKVDYPTNSTIINLFESQANKTPDNIAVCCDLDRIDYKELNIRSTQLTNYLVTKGYTNSLIGIMLDRSIEMIVCILGILKSGNAYLPLDIKQPFERNQRILKESQAKGIIVNNQEQKFEKIEHIDLGLENVYKDSATCILPKVYGESLAYVIYTSGSTGIPKGVMVTHDNLVNFVVGMSSVIPENDQGGILSLTTISFDIFGLELYVPLLKGASMILVKEEEGLDVDLLCKLVRREEVSVLQLTPSRLNLMLLNARPNEIFEKIKIILIGGEELPLELLSKLRALYSGKIYNMYGPTETTIWSTYKDVSGKLALNIGKPISNTQMFVLNKSNKLVPIGVVGELCIGGNGVTKGYFGDSDLTKEKFIENPFNPSQKIYKTGDLASWLPDGNIEFLGRIDHQVKIRGFRIELGEIESCLLKHELVKEAVVISRKDSSSDHYLCAYIVIASEESNLKESLRTHLIGFLPEYMIPSYFVELEEIPLTNNGKVNRKALPLPEIKAGAYYVVPSNDIEEKLVKMWSEVLNIAQEDISVTVSFFAIGGHSLKATILISRIHKEFGVRLPLMEIFQKQTISKIAISISEASKADYSSIRIIEKREYYILSSAQKRMYFIQQLDLHSISYNMPMIIPLGSDIKTESLENAFVDLVSRHESFRTSFITINNESFQRIYDKVNFKLDSKETTRQDLDKDIKEYIRPFDLSKDLLIRACLMNVSNEQFVLVVDMHHIISDGSSGTIIREDFLKLFNGEKLNPLKLQYKDFSNWQNKLIEKGELKNQEIYWKNLFSGDIPTLNLPTDFKRPESFTFKGDICRFILDEDDTALLRELCKGMGSTLYMNVLAILNTLFYRFSDQEDIIIGSGIAGRPHSDLLGISGMFVNTLAMRNYPNGDMPFIDFLKEVSNNSIAAFENQDVQFEDLVDMLDVDRDMSRNPLFDINMVVQNFEDISEDQREEDVITEDDSKLNLDFAHRTSKFDMIFFVFETVKTINISIEYYSDIFKRETIEKYIRCFKSIVSSVIKNPKIKLKDIELLSQEEKQQLLYEFNDTQSEYPKDKTIHELFEKQVDKTPDKIALGFDQEQITYRELDNKSNQIAYYLRFECEVNIDECIGIYMDKGANAIISILGILKSGCGYLPLSVSYPEERIMFMINDTSTRVIISEKGYVKEMNKFQWECLSFKTYMCLDSFKVNGEQETQSRLNNRKLWEYVGDESVDEVTGGGWNSSYTGQPIPQEEMDEYGDNVLKKLEPLITSQTRILEIGCASGISMFRIAPKVALYYGTDLSGTILKKNEERINSEGYSNIIQERLSADEIDQIKEKDFDLVIINSVIQCFDGHNYLKKVIRKAIDLMKPEGLMFLGDIMDQDLKNDLIKDLEEFKRSNRNKDFKTKTDWNEELFLSRGFWNDLQCEESSIERIESSSKISTLENELTKYRYDVLVSIDKNQEGSVSVKEKNKYQHDLNVLSTYPIERLLKVNTSENLAYIIYTSGSTGNPKGVIVEHKNVLRLVKETNYIDFNSGGRLLQTGALEFDASTFEIWGSLLNGITLFIEEKDKILVPTVFEDIIKKKDISTLWLSSSFFNNMLDERIEIFESLENLLVGGEALSSWHVNVLRDKYPKLNIINGYGPTENVTFSTTHLIKKNYEEGIPIGKPILNSTAYILGKNQELMPLGAIGELYVGGDGVSRGYMNNQELTDERFLKILDINDGLLYKTGDMARWLPDGTIEFLGRIDHQVKIRGFRIELGEIENSLLKHENIKESVVLVREGNNDKYLCAYVVCKEAFKQDEIRNHLSANLPDHMIPSYFVELEELPLSTNGKVNRKALPSPEVKVSDDYVAPTNEIEEKLVNIWSEVLNIEKEKISIDAGFFELGGHSLKAMTFISRINKDLGVEITIKEVFVLTTIRNIAEYISKLDNDEELLSELENLSEEELSLLMEE